MAQLSNLQAQQTPQTPQTPQNLPIKFVKGIPYFVDAENNAYLFIKSTSETHTYPKVIIGKLDGPDSITMLPDWHLNPNAIQCLNLYRQTLTPFERTEHTKAVKITRKKGGVAAAAATTAEPAPAAQRRTKSQTKEQTGAGKNKRKSTKSAQSP